MEQFAILHETLQGQILITKDFDYAEGSFSVTLRFDIDEDLTCTPALKFKSESVANNAFENMKNVDNAKKIANEALEGIFVPLFT